MLVIGDSSEYSRTISSSSGSGKSFSSEGEGEGCRGAAEEEGECWVRSSEKSRSWVEIWARREAVSASFAVGGLDRGGGVGGCADEGDRGIGVVLAGGVGGGESSRWIWVLLTKKSSKLSSGMECGFAGGGMQVGFLIWLGAAAWSVGVWRLSVFSAGFCWLAGGLHNGGNSNPNFFWIWGSLCAFSRTLRKGSGTSSSRILFVNWNGGVVLGIGVCFGKTGFSCRAKSRTFGECAFRP